MTTIAWDGQTLAADSCSWSGGARRRVRKVFKVRSPDGRCFLVAFAGNGSFALAVLAWMRGKRDRPDPLTFMGHTELPNQCALVIDEKKRIWQLGNELTYSQMQERVYAFGAGQEFAWGALEAGATATQAIRIAMKRSDYAGLGVDSVRFA
jgi:hypothetical protein